MKQANTTWNEALGKIDIETSDNDSRTVFYTSLYHAFIQPSLASDVDGRYRTMGHEIKQDASYTNYTVFSLWDTFRAAHLSTLLLHRSRIRLSFVRCFVSMMKVASCLNGNWLLMKPVL